MRLTYFRETKNSEAILTSISGAKKLLKADLKSKGELSESCAWTEHYDRDGGMFEVTMIELTGNNSHFKYNQHFYCNQ